jgi:hypothetical protein
MGYIPAGSSSLGSYLQTYNYTNFVNMDNNAGKFGYANPYWTSQSVYFLGGMSGSDAPSRVNRLNSYSVSATVAPTTSVGVARIFLGYGDNFEHLGKSLVADASAKDYTKDFGKVFVNHGYPVVAPNTNVGTVGVFQFGSRLTGNDYYCSLINLKSVGNQNSSGGKPKTAFTTLFMNSDVGDMVLDNSDFVFISPESMVTQDIRKYGNKNIDRLFVRDNSNIDISSDIHGYLHFGRILSAGSTGGTGSVYGGIVFQGDNNQVFTPAAGTRLWVSVIDGQVTDNRQQSMLLGYVATNQPVGKLADGNLPGSLDSTGVVSSTTLFSPYSSYVGYKNPTVTEHLNLTELEQGDINEVAL